MDEERTLGEILAELVTGLQAPLSLGNGVLGAAEAPYRELRNRLGLLGWHDQELAQDRLERLLGSAAFTVLGPPR